MTRNLLRVITLSFLCLPITVFAGKSKDVVDTKEKLYCSTSSPESVSKRIKPKDTETISIDIKKINWNKDDPSKPPLWGSSSQITVTKDGVESSASLIKSTKDLLAFDYAIDGDVSIKQPTKLYVYEINLDNLKYKRTEMTIFNQGSNSVTSFDGKCSKF